MIDEETTYFTWFDIAGAIYRKLKKELGEDIKIFKTPYADEINTGKPIVRFYSLGEREIFGSGIFEQRFEVAVSGGNSYQKELEEISYKINKALHKRVINGVLIRKKSSTNNGQYQLSTEILEYRTEFNFINWN